MAFTTKAVRFAALVLGVLLTLAALAGPCAAERERRAVRVGISISSDVTTVGPAAAKDGISGFDADYLRALVQYTGWKCSYVIKDWTELLEMLKRGEIDLLNYVSKTPDRERVLAFGEYRSGFDLGVVVVLPDSPLAYGDIAALDKLRVGVRGGITKEPAFREFCALHKIAPRVTVYPSFETLNAALRGGIIDAAVSSDDEFTDLRTIAEFAPQDVFFATGAKNQDILRELNYALGCIERYTPTFEAEMRARYFTHNQHHGLFTREERAYIASRPRIQVMYDTSWAPFEYLDAQTGAYDGINPALFAHIARLSGLSFEYAPNASTVEALNAFSRSKAEMLTVMTGDTRFAEKNNVFLTPPFLTSRIVCLTLGGANSNTRLAQTRGGFISRTIRARFPDAQVLDCAHPRACMDAVLDGRAEATYLNEHVVMSLMQEARYRRLQSRVYDGFSQPLSIGVSRTSDPRLHAILCKCLHAMGEKQISALIATYTGLGFTASWRDVLYTNPLEMLIAVVVAVLLGCALIGLLWRAWEDRRHSQAMTLANQAKSDFLSRMSHDMRTPMNVIIGLTAMAREKTAEPAVQDCLSKIESSGRFLLRLVNDVLDMAKIENRRMDLHAQPMYPAVFVEGLRTLIEPLCREKGLRFTVDAPDPQHFPPVMADELRLRQIFFNLLSNAVKFTPEGGAVALRITPAPASEGVIWCEYVVQDTGIGMSPEFQKRLFQAFEQESAETSARLQGTGLGLVIVKSLVELMGGSIECDSEQDKGTTFRVRLPMRLAPPDTGTAPEEMAAPASEQHARLAGKRVLLVEDQPLNVLVADNMLEKMDLIVEHAENGQQAVDMFAAAPVDHYAVILMDVLMPVLDGLAATRAIRAQARPDAATVPIVAMTANAFEDDRQNSRAAGMNAHLTKPIEPEEMYRVLAQVCRQLGHSKA